MNIRLDGRTALVTGAGRSIGRAIAVELGRSGAEVVCAFQRDEQAAIGAADEIRDSGGRARVLCVDVTDPASVGRASDELGGWALPIDILVNNAAIRPRTRIEDVTPEDWDQVHNTNLRGPFLLLQAVLPGMRMRGWGRVVNIGGVTAYRGSSQRPHSTASKLGLVGLTRAVACEVALDGITVNTVVPGVLDTVRHHPEWAQDQAAVVSEALRDIPVGVLGRPEDVAAACTFLSSDQASYITGQELFVTGGAFPLVRASGE